MGRRRKQPGSGCVLERPANGQGTVYQIRWRVNGGPARYETTGADRDEAEQALALKLAEINTGTYKERREATFLRFSSDWFSRKEAGLKPATVVDYKLTLERHLLPFFGEYLLDQISTELIERYVSEKVAERKEGDARVAELEAELAERKRNGSQTRTVERKLYQAKRDRGLCNGSINKTLTRLTEIMEAAKRAEYLDRNPVENVARLKAAKKVKPFLQLDQVEPLIEATDAEHRTLILTLLLSGLRIGEALALRWCDVDLLSDPPRLTVRRSLYRRGIEGAAKTGDEGTVTFGPRLLRTLLDHKAGSRFDGDDALVFCTSDGRHLNPSNVRQRALRPAVERANAKLTLEGRPPIPADLTPHRLRDTYCSLLIAQGEDVATVAAQMRHSDLTTTLRIYTHVMQHSRQGVAERLDAAIWGSNTYSGRKEVANARLRGASLAGEPTAVRSRIANTRT